MHAPDVQGGISAVFFLAVFLKEQIKNPAELIRPQQEEKEEEEKEK